MENCKLLFFFYYFQIRYLKVVCSTRVRQNNNLLTSYGSILFLSSIWLFAFLLSSPLIFFNRIETMFINLDSSFTVSSANGSLPVNSNSTSDEHVVRRFKRDDTFQHEFSDSEINIHHCIENSPFIQSRLIYSYVSFLIQYTLPILIVALAYGNIWWKLKKHRNKLKKHKKVSHRAEKNALGSVMSHASIRKPASDTNLAAQGKQNSQTLFEKSRRLKMNLLLAFIAIIFAASWLPLNIFNILSDSKNSIIKADHTFYIVNAICILFGMSSAVSNPILYGVLNENFKKEYVRFFNQILGKIPNCCRQVTVTQQLDKSEGDSVSKCDNNRALCEKLYGSQAFMPKEMLELKEQANSNGGTVCLNKAKHSDELV